MESNQQRLVIRWNVYQNADLSNNDARGALKWLTNVWEWFKTLKDHVEVEPIMQAELYNPYPLCVIFNVCIDTLGKEERESELWVIYMKVL